ncbi:DUF6499 domain-containing protein [Filomicrobium sp.]|uniref:transcriptional regulator domain-containing protein n=1 Tax=Filomicrobium sp. TaxID=2024831 RepID=UPI00258D3DC9|nr:DUF6499 domain-containing protein [Filomicrobium sp.]MCV0368934.1 DUF6499 domain-containing protein [Filomicrobium sp.]
MQGEENWRSSAAYDYLDSLPAADLAWEFLRRNEEYRREYSEIVAIADPDDPRKQRFSQHWGLSFRPRSERSRAGVSNSLDAGN